MSRIPLLLLALLALFEASHSHPNTGVWVPTPDPPSHQRDDPEAALGSSVNEEYAEVASVFAKPSAKLVYDVDTPSEQAVPWTSIKQEWDLYKKFHEDRKKKVSKKDGSKESDEEEEDEEEGEEEEAKPKLPQAFFSQKNADDDEKDYWIQQKQVYKKEKKKPQDSEEDDEDDEDEEEDEDEPQDDAAQPKPAPKETPPQLENLTSEEREAVMSSIFAAHHRDPSEAPTKGDTGDDLQDDKGGKKKKKKKKKKGKKKGHGGGWAKPIIIPFTPKVEHKGWGKHDGVLEQLVKGSTWERVLAYYHHKRDESVSKDKGAQKGEHADLGHAIHLNKEKLVDKMFKGSFWDRAYKTYAAYKNSQYKKGGKPAKEWEMGGLNVDW